MNMTNPNKVIVSIIVGIMILSGFMVFIPLDGKADIGGPDEYGYVWTDSNPPAPTVQKQDRRSNAQNAQRYLP